MLRLSLLGTPEIVIDGRSATFDTRKAVALLAYLAVTRQPQSREALALLLWPDYDTAHARAALRRTLSTARTALGDRWLAAGRRAIHLEWEGVELDVQRFRRLIERSDIPALLQAASLYRGDFMSGFGLRDSVEFDDWQVAEAEALRRELAHGLEHLSRALAAEGESRRAIEQAHRWLGLDPLSERAHGWLMELLARSGDRAAAIRQYRACVRVLDQELGVAPLPETTELYEAIAASRLPPPAASRLLPTEGPALDIGSYPLVGRETETAALTRAYRQVADADAGAIVGIEGEPGIGKTRLANELVAHAARAGAPAIVVRCHEGEQRIAYAPWVEAVRRAVEIASRDALATVEPHLLAEATLLAPELNARWTDLPDRLGEPGAQARLFEAVTRIVTVALGGAQPGILVLDDLQWADGASLDLLAYFSHRMSDRRLCIVACRRPERVGDGGPEHRLFAELAERGSVVRPGRLAAAEIGQLASQIGASVSWVDRLTSETEGLPYFVVEYLTALAGAAGAQASESVPLPRGVRSLLRSRTEAVGQAARQLLSAAAVIGRSFDADLVRETSGRDEEEVVISLEELSARGLIRELKSPRRAEYDFTHDQLRQLVYQDTSMARRRLLHRRVAGTLARRARQQRTDAAAALVASHYQAAGEDQAAASWFRRAGDATRDVHASDQALSHYRAALAIGTEEPAALHEAIGELETLAGDYEAAVADYEAAAASAPAERLAGLEHKLGAVHQRRGAWSVAESHFARALELLEPGDDGSRARIVADQSLNAYRQGKPATAMDRARKAMTAARSGTDLLALAQVHNLLGILESSRHRRGLARRHLTESLRLAEELGGLGARIAALNNLALVERGAGNVDRAVELTHSALEACATQGDRHREAALRNNLADLLYGSGQSERAMEELKRAVSIFAEIGQWTSADDLQPEIWKLVEW